MNNTHTKKAGDKDELVNKFSKNMRKLLDNRDITSTPTGQKAVKFNPQTIETSFHGTQTPGKIKDSSVLQETITPNSHGLIGSSVELMGPTPEVVSLLNSKKPDAKANSGKTSTNKTTSLPLKAGSKTGNIGANKASVTPTMANKGVKGQPKVSQSSVELFTSKVDGSKSKTESVTTNEVAKGQSNGSVKGPLVVKADRSPMKSANSAGRSRLDRSPIKSARARADASPMRTSNNGSARARVDKSPARSRADPSPVKSANNGSARARLDKSPARSSNSGTPRARVDKSPLRASGNGPVRLRADASPMRSSNNARPRVDAYPVMTSSNMKVKGDTLPLRPGTPNSGNVKTKGDVNGKTNAENKEKAKVENNINVKASSDSNATNVKHKAEGNIKLNAESHIKHSPVVTASKSSSNTVKSMVKTLNKTEGEEKNQHTPKSKKDEGKTLAEKHSNGSEGSAVSVKLDNNHNTPISDRTVLSQRVRQPVSTNSKPPSHGEVPTVTKQLSMTTKATPLKPPSGKRPGMATPLAREAMETSIGGGGGGGMYKTPSPFVMKNRRFTMDELKDCQATPDCFTAVAFETPSTGVKHRWSSGDVALYREDGDQCNMTVAVRVRPFQHRELDEPGSGCVISMQDNETVLTTDKDTHRFTYDYSFWSCDQKGGAFASQLEVYNHLAQPMLSKAFDGYNTCLFAYGQTGSGKSYSIMGHEQNPDEVGIIPRFSDQLFSMTELKSGSDTQTTYNIEISYFEIYNEKIHDLLCPSIKDKRGKKPNLKVREHSEFGPYVEGLSTYVVNSYNDIKRWLSVGNKHRATAATCMNEKSSRSHSVFTVILTQNKVDVIDGQSHEHAITSKVNLVDLAGSERQSLAKTSGDRLREGSNINKSLHTLGKVISVLAEQSGSGQTNRRKKQYIPYRDSVLTWLLKESVGGNSKTAMLATISPSALHADETLSTLKYANQAKQIVNKVKVNEDPKARLIRELKAEIERLRLSKEGEEVPAASYAEVAALKDKLMLKELQMQEMTKTWQEKMKRSEEKQMEEARVLEKSGVAFTVDNKLPNLVNLNEDPQLSEVLLYVLKPGTNRVGQTSDGSTADIQLSGALIADSHCTLCNSGDKVTITPVSDASTYINGNLITAETRLHHGDRVIIGGDHYFRLNFPVEVQNRRSGDVQLPSQPRDFEYARQELIRVQNEKLEEELECARQQQSELADRLQRQQEVMDQVKEEASLRLEEQRNEFQDRLGELERKLLEEKENKSESQAEVIQKLELEKLMLEQEVTSNRKRMEMEAKAQQKAVENYQPYKSSLLDTLNQYREKLRNEVDRLEAVREKRHTEPPAAAVSKATASPGRFPSVSQRKDLYKYMLLVREASQISQQLKKFTSFAIEDQKLPDSKETQTLVKVTNTKLSVSTYWTLEKFEDNLVKMREIYEGDTEQLGVDEDDVFYDPSDTWEKEDRLDLTLGLSPKLWKSVRLQGSPKFSQGSTPGDLRRTLKLSSTGGSSVSQLKSCDLSVLEVEETQVVVGQSVVNMFREGVSASVREFRNTSFKESCADRLLNQCDILKYALAQILDMYNNREADKAPLSDCPGFLSSLRSLDSGLSSLQLVASLWLSHYETLDSGLVRELLDRIVTNVRKLGKHTDLFLQGVDYDIDSMVQEASAQAFESLFILCRCCGELALATETTMATLVATSTAEESHIREGVDLRKYFLRGCEAFVDKTLQGGLKTLEDCEVRVMELGDEVEGTDQGLSGVCELIRQVEVGVCSCKVLVEKLQQLQVELDGTINSVTRDSLLPGNQSPRAADFYQQSYSRCQALIGQLSNLADGVSLTTQAAGQLMTGGGDSSLRRLFRCTEMVQKAANQIVSSSLHPPDMSLTSDTNNPTENSVLSDTQLEQVDVAGQEIQFSMATLGVLVKRQYEATSGKSAKAITSPSSGSVQKSPSKRHKQTLQLVDLAER